MQLNHRSAGMPIPSKLLLKSSEVFGGAMTEYDSADVLVKHGDRVSPLNSVGVTSMCVGIFRIQEMTDAVKHLQSQSSEKDAGLSGTQAPGDGWVRLRKTAVRGSRLTGTLFGV